MGTVHIPRNIMKRIEALEGCSHQMYRDIKRMVKNKKHKYHINFGHIRSHLDKLEKWYPASEDKEVEG